QNITLGVKTVRRTLSTHSSYPDAGQLPTGIDRALRLLIPLPVLIRNDQGGVGWTGVTRYLHCLRSGRRRSPPRPSRRPRSLELATYRPAWPLALACATPSSKDCVTSVTSRAATS